MMSILKDFHDQSFEDDVNFKEFEEKKIITKQEDNTLHLSRDHDDKGVED